MYLDNQTDALIKRLRLCAELGDIKFILAFPYSRRPCMLRSKVAVIVPEHMELESAGVDGLDYIGKASVGIHLFSPFRLGSPLAFDTMQRIVEQAVTPLVSKISISPIETDESTECYRLKAVLTFDVDMSKEAENE
ncbi:hypothetical protein [uncultured Eubacterium sp.]|uniref:hypothetical protein n=1 Tax=uncultured Eubacterium sp. TaxID=165185 RepID=UPI0015B36A51|nr:hypothetical protein [uncultured Eubacterium sp.]DAL36928.1 MAG TPA_asm: hypothetical protein [Caudoviricetes sp.]